MLKPLELIDAFRETMEVFAYEESLIEKGDCFQRFAARKPINGKKCSGDPAKRINLSEINDYGASLGSITSIQ